MKLHFSTDWLRKKLANEPDEPHSWQSVADTINMQNDEWKPKVAAKFGLSLNGEERHGA